MTATAGLLITNAINQVFEENDLEFNSEVVDNYNEKIKNRVNTRRKQLKKYNLIITLKYNAIINVIINIKNIVYLSYIDVKNRT